MGTPSTGAGATPKGRQGPGSAGFEQAWSAEPICGTLKLDLFSCFRHTRAFSFLGVGTTATRVPAPFSLLNLALEIVVERRYYQPAGSPAGPKMPHLIAEVYGA